MRTLWNQWKIIAKKIGHFQAMVIFSILYFLILTPVALVSSIFKDYLVLRQDYKWEEFPQIAETLEDMKSQ